MQAETSIKPQVHFEPQINILINNKKVFDSIHRSEDPKSTKKKRKKKKKFAKRKGNSDKNKISKFIAIVIIYFTIFLFLQNIKFEKLWKARFIQHRKIFLKHLYHSTTIVFKMKWRNLIFRMVIV